MGKGPGLYPDIGKKAKDLLYKDYQCDHKFSLTTYSANGLAITSSGTKKGEAFLADVSTKLTNKNITTDVKVDTNSKLLTTITIDEAAPGLKTILSFVVPDQRSGKVELQYLHEYAGISTSVGLTASPIINFSGVAGNNTLAFGTDLHVSFTSKELAPGLKTIFSCVIPDKRSGRVELQYSHKYAGISTSVGLTANPIVNFSGVTGNNTVAVGTDVSFDTASGTFNQYNVALSFSNSDFIASLTLNDKTDTLMATYYHTVNPLTNTAVGAEFKHGFSGNNNSLTIGTQHSLDPLTMVKARVNNAGIVSALLQRQWLPKSVYIISGEVDTRAINKIPKFGLAFRKP